MLLVPLCIGRGEVVAVSAADDGVLALERLLAACSSLESALTLGRRRLKVMLDVERLARSTAAEARARFATAACSEDGLIFGRRAAESADTVGVRRSGSSSPAAVNSFFQSARRTDAATTRPPPSRKNCRSRTPVKLPAESYSYSRW